MVFRLQGQTCSVSSNISPSYVEQSTDSSKDAAFLYTNLRTLLINTDDIRASADYESFHQQTQSTNHKGSDGSNELSVSLIQTTCHSVSNHTTPSTYAFHASTAAIPSTAIRLQDRLTWKATHSPSQMQSSWATLATSLPDVNIAKDIVKTDPNNGAAAKDTRSHIFALVFGIFGGVLVLGIALLIFKSIHAKSKNKVKKVKRKKGRLV